MVLRPLAAAVTLVALAACAQPTAAGPGGATSSPAAPETTGAPGEQLPSRLIGLWSVDAADVGEGVLLRVGPDDLVLFEECGDFYGGWDANPGGAFVASFGGHSGACSPETPTPPWLAETTAFKFDGAVASLLDGTGTPTATLQPATAESLPPDVAPGYAEVPVATDEDRQRLDTSPVLPPGLIAATAETLVGRWVPDRPVESEAFVAFEPNGSWRGSDGCNGIGGAWAVGAGGMLLAVAGPQTLIGCAGADFGGWVPGAVLAGFDGTSLVLLDHQGNEIGRLLAG